MQPLEKGSLPLSIHGVRKGKSFPEQLRVSSEEILEKKYFLLPPLHIDIHTNLSDTSVKLL